MEPTYRQSIYVSILGRVSVVPGENQENPYDVES